MQETYRKISQLIASQDFDTLNNLPISKPEYFNWATEIFEGLYVKEQPNERALVWTDGEKDVTLSYQELKAQSDQFINFVRKQGIKQNDVIMIQLSLQVENWIIHLATIKAGLKLIPAATILGAQDLAYRFNLLIPQVVVADVENAYKFDEATATMGIEIPLKIIIGGKRDGWVSFEDVYNEPTEAEGAVTKADDPLFLFFTSGTTGMPKIVVHSHLSYPFGSLTTASWIGLRKGDLHYNISQPGWAKFAWSCFFAPLSIGASVFAYHQTGRFNPSNQLAAIEKYKVTTFCAPPTVLRMLNLEDVASYKFSLRTCVAAGEPLNPEVIEVWEKATGIALRDGYGQTESTCLVANLPGKKLKPGSMGLPTFLYTIDIVDNDGNVQAPGKEGSIAVKMGTGKPNGIFADYFGDSEKMNSVFKNGYYYTGDKAFKDEDGYIWFVGRDDDVIKASDYRVGPFEVESVLIEHDAVIESAVVASPHPLYDQLVKAFIVLHKDFAPSENLANELFHFSRQNLAPYKMPRIIEFVTELPKTISGKIRRIELREQEYKQKKQGNPSDSEFHYKSKNKS